MLLRNDVSCYQGPDERDRALPAVDVVRVERVLPRSEQLDLADPGAVAMTADGRAANEESDAPTISDDNRYILFSSSATDLAVSNFDSNSVTFLYDRQTAQLSQINPPRLAGRQRGGFFGGRLAPDGRFITMLADVTASAGGSNYVTGVFLYDRLSGALTELSRKRDGTPGNDHSVGAAVSADGRYITLDSRASNLIGETTSGVDQVLLYGRMSPQMRSAIQNALPAMSDDNQRVLTAVYLTAISGDYLIQH